MSERIAFGKCPLCDSPSLTDSVTGNCAKHPLYHSSLNPVIRWKQCGKCAHVFTDGYFTESVCKLIYSKTNEHQQVGFELEKQRITSSHIVEKVLPYAAEGHWLDVGFGNGSLLFTVQEYGFVPVGLDLRADTVRLMASLGIESHCVDITRFSFKSRFSVISMADVLEHMPYPKNGLKAAHALLADRGVVFISMPNLESAVWQALTANKVNPYWDELEHYHNFSRSRLYALLREFGFEPVRYGISERYRACMEIIARKI
jgi:SAM-dependent methyltransferase